MKHPLSTVWLSGLLVSPLALAESQTLEVELLGVQHERGALRIGLYSEPKTFRKEAQAFAIQQIPAQAGTASVRFTDLPAGRYAIMAYHDEDANGELNRRFGMFPTEGYALSNNPTVMGPPSFEDSAFEVVEGGENRVSLDLRY